MLFKHSRSRDAQEGEDRYILMADLCCCMAETNQHCNELSPNKKSLDQINKVEFFSISFKYLLES